MKVKRETTQVIRDILKCIQEKDGKIKPTHIQYKANLSSQMLKEYITDLIIKEFIVETIKKKVKTYSLTIKGIKYLNEYKKFSEFLETFGLE